MEFYFVVAVFFFIAITYSSVGFGGGSSYLALLAVLSFQFDIIRPTALLCNIVVVTGGTYLFYKEGYINLKKALPFVLVSIPMSFLGGYFPIKEKSFFIILGFSLVIAALLLWFQKQIQNQSKNLRNSAVTNVAVGGSVGFLSGLVSIGGGIFLSPILHLLKWDEVRKISAIASLFILVNSISGLAGQLTRAATIDWNFTWPLLLAVFVGGQIGSRLGVHTFNPVVIKRITAILIFIAGGHIIYQHW
jgi:uncharacterized membrane protein YfcA